MPRTIRAVLLDMDGTLTRVRSPWQYIHEQAGTWKKEGEKLLKAFLNNQITYEQFCIQDAAVWTKHGLNLDDVNTIIDTITPADEAIVFLKSLNLRGVNIAIISTGFLSTAYRIIRAAELSPNSVMIAANNLYERSGVITPELHVVPDDKTRSKDTWSLRFMTLLGVSSNETAAVGDSQSDQPMFDQVLYATKISDPRDLLKLPWLGLLE